MVQWLSDSKEKCDLVLTFSNWNDLHTLLVKATLDGKTDGDQDRQVLVSAYLGLNVTVDIKIVEVDIYYGFHKLLYIFLEKEIYMEIKTKG